MAGIASMYDLREVSSACCFLQKVVVSLDARHSLMIVWISRSRAVQNALAQPLSDAPYETYGDELELTMPPWLADGRGVVSSYQCQYSPKASP